MLVLEVRIVIYTLFALHDMDCIYRSFNGMGTASIQTYIITETMTGHPLSSL